jgi:hypothetical protein
MSSTPDDRRREPLAVLLATALVGAVQVIGFAGVRLDDAFVTYRYGENLARGRGFVFNPGDRILGTTSPGHALVAAAAHAIAGHEALPGVMSAVGSLAWTAQAWLAYAIARRSLGVAPAALIALGIAAGAAGSFLFVPLETNLVTAVAMASALLAFSRRWSWAGIALGLATLLRADAILLGLPLLVLALRDRGRDAVRAVLAFLPVPVAWEVFSQAYFGALAPHTLGAKAHASSIATYSAHAARLALESLLPQAHLDPAAGVAAGLCAWCVAGYGWRLAVRRDPRVVVLPAWGALHLGVYVLLLRPGTAFSWHLYVPSLMAVLGLLHFVAAGIEGLQIAWARFAAVGLATALAAWNALVFSVEYPDLLWYGARDACERSVAGYLRERARPGDVVDSEEVGTLAYYSDLAMLDHPGLVTREDLAALPGPDQVEHHCRNLASLARLRFLVMSRFEVPVHRCLLGADGTLAAFEQRGSDHTFRLWVADRQSAPAP